MAVLSINEFKSGRSGERGQAGRRRYTREFFATTSDAHTDSKSILDHNDCPKPYDVHPEDSGAVVTRINVQQVDNSRLHWKVTVDYDSEYEVRDNPFTEPPDIQIDTDAYEEAVFARTDLGYDPNSENPAAGDPLNETVPNGYQDGDYCTSAGEPFDPPITIGKTRGVITFTKNYPTFLLSHKHTFENTVNSEPWSGYPRRHVLLRSIKATSHVQKSTSVGIPDVYYFRVSYVFAMNPLSWDVQIPDIGSFYRDYTENPNGEIKPFFTKAGTPRMGRLDHSDVDEPGKKLTDGQPVQFLKFADLRQLRNFNDLGIDLGMAINQRRARPRY